ncbi:hypothetical protein CYO74_004478 [Salmonella enterica subsp. enterica serovar Berta]|nr:hypothetical protein [Salmonella enterica subsp. enterica serovar Berta]ECU0233070.1 hypothetical protein [Salmonella enterica subsp. enterica serovar Enteritidis]EBZ8270866.1 hypothetical protein [Salmonella enterica subsp. enterica serovar Berta]ECH1662190.1 hypothetical protein [Salmonella enterica subsp. enterica serovar Berta]ECV1426925.1 hypothetical protein [Salmonella enterica subsp. enterica serovar Berta]
MGSCAAPSAKGDDKFITTDYLQQCPKTYPFSITTKRFQLQEFAYLIHFFSYQWQQPVALSRVLSGWTDFFHPRDGVLSLH